MPDLQQFVVTPAAGGKYHISYLVCDSTTGAVLVDHTGANFLVFPDQFTAASAVQQLAWVGKWCMDLIRAADPTHFS